MAEQKPKPITVTVLRHHTFGGVDYEPGATYDVAGDQSQTAEQYVDSLRALNFARPVGEEGGPHYVEEVGAPTGTTVAPLSTETFVQEAPAVKPAAAKPASKPAKVAKSAKKPAAAGGKKR